MKIHNTIKKFSSATFFEDYLKAHGVTDIEEFVKPTGKYNDKPESYDNMEEAYELITKHEGELIYILVD